jgi:V-type H+-transporting ATPase subunit H
LILTHDTCGEFFLNQFEEEKRCVNELFNLMIKENNFNTIYESLFCFWNLSNNANTIAFFDNKKEKYLEKIVQVIKTNKIDKIARIGLMIIRNVLDSESCLEILFDIKFMRTIDILLTNKWNDHQIKENLNFIYDHLEKNYKIMK